MQASSVAAELIAVLVAVTGSTPKVLTIAEGKSLPSGPLSPEHRSLQAGVRAWVERQTHHPLGYVEQLYTFADNDRNAGPRGYGRAISISYLGLTREQPSTEDDGAAWGDWYDYFPWEDRRRGSTGDPALAQALQDWADAAASNAQTRARALRVAVAFGLDGRRWNEEIVLQRYELLYEAGLVAEAARDGITCHSNRAGLALGRPMQQDHRRILATGIARLRAKITYRPVVFELMPPMFTLLDLQRSVEALAGRLLHKQNFRRLVEQQELVEETGIMAEPTGGRPAKLFRFRADVLQERAYAGTKPPLARS
ncbi:MAG: hypothetical protein B7Z75_00205 [Acidocella sp. 20-57-95]|nr:MAG: hypothetical protein B7Z75_00205 [Acidocella sp. 20-57-95]OYV62282.1 MAG: hypothetical protein B7Z71_01795 [Acidocella sp. 21-58-7]HQT63344.1 hypothetical protein [Acidocella sp.]HQU03939.1 hypothetical protein [Acidocella sp.]